MLYILSIRKKTKDDLLKEFLDFCKNCLGKNFCYEIVELKDIKLVFIVGENLFENKNMAECLYEFENLYENDNDRMYEIKEANFGQINDIEILCFMMNKNYHKEMHLLQEEIITPQTPKQNIISVIADKIGSKLQLISKSKLLITDPYFLKYRDEDLSLIENLFKVISKISKYLKEIILIIPQNLYFEEKKESLEKLLKNMGLELKIILDSENLFHDRFWLFFNNDILESKGLVIGTSINGLGKKYALVTYLDEDDCLEISKEIKDKFYQ